MRGTTNPVPCSGWDNLVAPVSEGHRCRGRVGHRVAQLRQRRIDRAQQRRRDIRRHGQHDTSRTDPSRCRFDRVAARPRQLVARALGHDGSGRERARQRVDQFADPARQRDERALRRRPNVQRPERADHASRAPFGIDQTRKQRADRQAIDVAGMDAGQQRFGQIVDRLARRSGAATNAPIDSSSSMVRRGVRISPAIRALPASEKSRDRASAPTVIGNPRNDPSAIACSRPSRSTYAVRGVSVGTSRSAIPSSRHSATAAGFCTRSESGPASMTQSSKRSVAITPPTRAVASRTRTREAARLQIERRGQPGDSRADDRDVNDLVARELRRSWGLMQSFSAVAVDAVWT